MSETWDFYRHMPVYLAGGDRLGHVLEVGHANDYIRVQQGRLLIRDWYIPTSGIRDVTGDGVYLSVTRAQLLDSRWNVPPQEYLVRQGATPGYEYAVVSNTPRHLEPRETTGEA